MKREDVQTANEDKIRNFAYGRGDDKPLYTDPHYAKKTRWGSVIAPGMMAGVINKPMLGDPVPDEIKALRKSLLRAFTSSCRGRNGISIAPRSEEHTSELQSLMRISYAVFCLKKKMKPTQNHNNTERTRER